MHRTEQSAIWISPKNGTLTTPGLFNGSNPNAGDVEVELQDLALAYGPHMPAAYVLFSISDDLKGARAERA